METRMKAISTVIMAVLISAMYTCCYALSCNCDDWMERGGYCVDYINERIPVFPIPQNTDEIEGLKNKDIPEITKGDVAMFNFSNYWHVAYVEKVHRNKNGDATAIDVSEMNFGDQLTFSEFKSTWKSKSESEWKRAVCCGVTDNYDQTSSRKNVALNTVRQIWSPVNVRSEDVSNRSGKALAGKVREVINRIFQRNWREL